MVSKEKRDEVYSILNLKNKTTMEDLLPICERCEQWCGKEHNFEDCRNQPCFELWLSNEYLEWCKAWTQPL